MRLHGYLPLEADLKRAYIYRIHVLDAAHRRATNPQYRQILEKKITEMHDALVQLEDESKVIDLDYERWFRAVVKALKFPPPVYLR